MLNKPAKKSIKPAIWLATGAILGLLLAAWFLPGGLELHITPLTKGGPLLVLPLNPGERFTVHYYHSVENAPVWEEHSLDEKGRIYIEEERYLKFGAGMGRMPGVGRMVRREPYEVIEEMHMPTGDFIMRIGSPGVDHTIIWRGTKTNLSAVAPHKAVRFSARPVSLLYKMYRSLFPHSATPAQGIRDL
ncbi:MAG: DUF1850 domain-containing protein [Proteobacteria bacterium]|nr:DUF1850 domain-containing protein [Desulfobacterales bacterium]MBL7171228.1 DUF1850 domain-containing protein [Desulfobacteraceae bacterium]MBU0735323.1 DUF1850 domain-containing protein [Pseudomonadota bacterium]MBU1901978.1 DUF1850 domain-containing protein [Pseudomonadota bacterium]